MELKNPVLERMRAGDVAMGMNVRLARSGDIARIAAATGHDFIFIDGQHAIFNLETIAHIAQAALGCGVAPLVRVRSVNDPDTAMLLDNGVSGIVFPDVNTVEDARQAVRVTRFPPIGRRSVGGGYPQFNHRPMPIADSMKALNAATVVVCMIETVQGLNNVEEIAAVEGIDVIHVGSNDLLVDMGKPGKFADPEIVAAQERVIAAAKKNGKYAGCGGNRDIARQAEIIRKGAQFLTTQADMGFLTAAASAWTTGVRAALANTAR
jgi:2-keto-3-deoxy-L-rhamnonate aldolase RhmA